MGKESLGRGGIILGVIMVAIASLLIGGYGGSQLAATYLVDQYINKDARDVQKQVTALQHLQAGDQQAAMELLESRLDDALILFDPQEPYQGLQDHTQAEISKAIVMAKEYRQHYPRSSKRRMVDDMVNNLFKKYQ